MLLAAALILAMLVPWGAHGGPRPAVVERVVWAMGTRLRVVVEDPSADRATAATEAALAEIERFERLLSTWDSTTAMGRLNAAPVGAPRSTSPELIDLLVEAEDWARRTDRAFDATVGALVDAWGLRGEGRRPSAPELASALEATGASAFVLDGARASAIRRLPGAWIDTGGFGKGAALRAAMRLLDERGVARAFLDFGGQVVGLAPEGSEPRSVDVAHPTERGVPVATLVLRDVSAATSGTSERWIEVDGERLGHLLDPRTGRPAPAWGSVTVVSADPLVADVLSTALYVMGPEAGLAWARSRADVGVLFLVERDGQVVPHWNPAMESWLDRSSISFDEAER